MNLEFTRSTLLVGSRCLTSILAITSGTLVHSALKFLLLPMPQEWRRAGSSKTAYTSTKWASHVTVLTTTSRKRSAEASETTSPSPKGPWKESGTSTSNSIEMCASSSTLLSWGKTIKKTGPISYLKTAFKAGNFSKSYSSREKTTNSTRRAPFPTTNSMNSSIATSISGTKASRKQRWYDRELSDGVPIRRILPKLEQRVHLLGQDPRSGCQNCVGSSQFRLHKVCQKGR